MPSITDQSYLLKLMINSFEQKYGLKVDYLRMFRGFPMYMSADVYLEWSNLEYLLDDNFNCLKSIDHPIIMDVGAGAGNITIAALKEIPNSQVISVEPDDKAMEFLKANVLEQGVAERAVLLPEYIENVVLPSNSLDAVIGNIPNFPDDPSDRYLSHAKYSGSDGLTILKQTVHNSEKWLKSGGFICLMRLTRPEDNPKTWFNEEIWESLEITPSTVRAVKR